MTIGYIKHKLSEEAQAIANEIFRLVKQANSLDVMGLYLDLYNSLYFFDEGEIESADGMRYELYFLNKRGEPIDGLVEMIGGLIEHPLGVPGEGLRKPLIGKAW